MSELVFVLGAGASKHAGAPLMNDFLDVAEHLYKNREMGTPSQAFELVHKAVAGLQKVHSKASLDLDNLESVFGAFEMAKMIRRCPDLSDDEIEQLPGAFRQVIAQTLERRVAFKYLNGQIQPSSDYNSFSHVLRDLHDQIPVRTYSVITFNYDLALDYALHFNSVPYDYCLGAARPGRDRPYLKLHGSLNWVRNNVGRIEAYSVFTQRRTSLWDEGDSVRFPVTQELAKHAEAKPEEYKDPTPVMVPPTWNKAIHQDGITEVWRQAALELGGAEEIWVSGYSLAGTDTYFRHFFALGAVGDTRIRRIVVSDPDPSGEVEKRYKEMLGPGVHKRLEFRRERFGQFVGYARQALLTGAKS